MSDMDVVVGILVVLHLLGWAIALGALFTTMKEPKVLGGVLHGLYLALLTGVLMWVLAAIDGWDVSVAKLATKLGVTLVVIALAIWGKRNPDKVTKGVVGAIAGLIVVNVAIAVMWR